MEKYIEAINYYAGVIKTYDSMRSEGAKAGKDAYYWAFRGILEVAICDNDISIDDFEKLQAMCDDFTN